MRGCRRPLTSGAPLDSGGLRARWKHDRGGRRRPIHDRPQHQVRWRGDEVGRFDGRGRDVRYRFGDPVGDLHLAGHPLLVLARYGFQRPVGQRRDMTGQHNVGVGRVKRLPIHQVASDGQQLLVESTGDQVLIGATGKIRHPGNVRQHRWSVDHRRAGHYN
jgi:hypothetical protein